MGKHLFADGTYDRLKLMDKAAFLDFVIEIVRRSDDQKSFRVLPRRREVERTFGWMTDGGVSSATAKPDSTFQRR